MPSEISKKHPNSRSPKKAWLGCTESRLPELAGELARMMRSRDRVLLEGEMGAGKSTLARHLLAALGIHQSPEGSPTFAIAHEYAGPRGEVIHIDLYRIRSEDEIEEAGVFDYLWNRDAIALVEWTSMWPTLEEALSRPSADRRTWRIDIAFSDGMPDARDIIVTQP